jgi:hypothetical protein
MRASTSSLWWMAITGPSARVFSSLSVTMVAISMMTSLSGSRPVISRSIQIRFCGFCMQGLLGRHISQQGGAWAGVLNCRRFQCPADTEPSWPNASSIAAKTGASKRSRASAPRAAKREQHALQELEGGDLGPEQLGLVIAHFGVQVEVEAQDGERRPGIPLPPARQPAGAGHRRPRGLARRQPGHRRDRRAMPRSTELCRPNSHGQLKPVAANVDLIVIVFAPAPEPHPT